MKTCEKSITSTGSNISHLKIGEQLNRHEICEWSVHRKYKH